MLVALAAESILSGLSFCAVGSSKQLFNATQEAFYWLSSACTSLDSMTGVVHCFLQPFVYNCTHAYGWTLAIYYGTLKLMGVCCNSITLSLFPSNVAWVLFISWEPCLCRLLAFSGSSVTWSTGALVSTDHHQAIAVSVFESPSKPKVYIKRICYAKVLNTETVTLLQCCLNYLLTLLPVITWTFFMKLKWFHIIANSTCWSIAYINKCDYLPENNK